MDNIFIDIETYCDLDLSDVGVYKYAADPSFEILLFAYAINDQPVQILDLTDNLIEDHQLIETLLKNKGLHAHNANFERVCLNKSYFETNISQWFCTMVKSAYCGLPLILDDIAKALNIKGKLEGGKALVNFFCKPCKPCKPTKANGGRLRNTKETDPEKWNLFKEYCIQDVEVERSNHNTLAKYTMPAIDWYDYILDQEINDRGIEIDLEFAKAASEIDVRFKNKTLQQIKTISGLDNPNSLHQLKQWIFDHTGKRYESLDKEHIDPIIEKLGAGIVRDVLQLRKKLGRTSVKKYNVMLLSAGKDKRSRGLFQFYGANRTGRWAGRLIQLQNLPRNTMKDLDLAREVIKENDFELAYLLFDDVPSVLSQLVRTAFVAPENKTFAVADFSAIEARVIAWLANETWRLDIFNTHGKIYEASASKMFGVPIEEVTKGSVTREIGKVSELAFGFGGAVGAFEKMSAGKIKLSKAEMKKFVFLWRKNNPNIVKLWSVTEDYAKAALNNPRKYFEGPGPAKIGYLYDGSVLQIKLPSGRSLFYQEPCYTINKFKKQTIRYKGLDQETKQWTWIETYGPKLVENIVQAIARDLLAFAMQTLNDHGCHIVMHVHDEIIAEVWQKYCEIELKDMIELMCIKPEWAKTLPLNADGYLTKYYKKD